MYIIRRQSPPTKASASNLLWLTKEVVDLIFLTLDMIDRSDSLTESFEELVRVAGHYMEQSKAQEKELNILRDEAVAKQKKVNELLTRISALEMNENTTNLSATSQTSLVDFKKASSLETEKARLEDELIGVRYENARLKSEKEHLERSLILNKSLHERETQKRRHQSVQGGERRQSLATDDVLT